MYKLFIYDHCPFCVKARMIFGLKNISVKLITLLNDDVDTPTHMIGKKMVPILESKPKSYMPESMDIINYIDQRHGDETIIAPSPNHQELKEARSELSSVLYKLTMPRWVKAPLDEFATQKARDFFIQKKEVSIGSFQENINKTDQYLKVVAGVLERYNNIIKSEIAVHGALTEDDIHFFADLRSLSIIKGIKYPEKVNAYRQTMSNLCNIPLHDTISMH